MADLESGRLAPCGRELEENCPLIDHQARGESGGMDLAVDQVLAQTRALTGRLMASVDDLVRLVASSPQKGEQ